jgi:hypothetical protein
MTRSLRRAAVVAAFLSFFSIVGCSDKPVPVYPVHGTVSIDGKPLADGQVCFRTVDTGALEQFEVKNGAFTGRAQAGERRVEIFAFKVRTGNFSGMKGEVQENLIPARYNTNSKLQANVTAEGPNEFAFDLKK